MNSGVPICSAPGGRRDLFFGVMQVDVSIVLPETIGCLIIINK